MTDEALPFGVVAASVIANLEMFRDDTGYQLAVGDRVEITNHVSLNGTKAEVVGLDLFDRNDDRTLGQNVVYLRLDLPESFVEANPIEAQALLAIHPARVRYMRRPK